MAITSKKTSTSSKQATVSEAKKATTKKIASSTAPTTKKTAATAVKKTLEKMPVIKAAVKRKSVPRPVAEDDSTAKTAVAKKSVSRKKLAPAVSPEQRYHMISTAAYFLAERRRFAGGYEMQDWISAEAEVDARLNS